MDVLHATLGASLFHTCIRAGNFPKRGLESCNRQCVRAETGAGQDLDVEIAGAGAVDGIGESEGVARVAHNRIEDVWVAQGACSGDLATREGLDTGPATACKSAAQCNTTQTLK